MTSYKNDEEKELKIIKPDKSFLSNEGKGKR